MRFTLNKMMMMSYRSKFTQDEFNAHHKEYIENYATKYSTMDLNFKMVMFMRGCTDEEFNDKMNELNNPKPQTKSYSWVDEDNDEYDSFSDGEDNKSYGGDDSNEY